MPKKRVTEELAGQWVHLHEKGQSFRSIGRQFGVDPRTVQAWFQKAGEERERQYWESVSRQVDSKYLDEHYRLLLQVAIAIPDAVNIDPIQNSEPDPVRLIDGVMQSVSRRAAEILKARGVDLGSAPARRSRAAGGHEDIATRLSGKLFDALMEHEPQLKTAMDRWKEDWSQFQQARQRLEGEAKGLLSFQQKQLREKQPGSNILDLSRIAGDLSQGLVWEALKVCILGKESWPSRIKPVERGEAEMLLSHWGAERDVCRGSPQEMEAAAEAYRKVLPQVSVKERLRPSAEVYSDLQNSVGKVEGLVDRLILMGKPLGRCDLCLSYSISLPALPPPKRSRRSD